MCAPAGSAPRRSPAEGRPEAAEVFRRFGPAYLRNHRLGPDQAKALRAAIACRTAVLGGHLDLCPRCGFSQPSYNSCRDRHCPTCQGAAAARWIEGRLDRVLPTPHFHVVFTLPAELRPLALANRRLVFDLLFTAATDTLLALGRTRLGATLGVTAVLHTWTRQMQFHPHLHCVATAGGLALEEDRWVRSREQFLFPVRVMADLFRGKFLARLLRARDNGRLRYAGSSAYLAHPAAFADLRRRLWRTRWIVYAKRPFGGVEHVLRYLGRYTHRVAISSSRLLSLSDRAIVFRTRGRHTCTLAPGEFLRRWLLHVLPPGFRKIRHSGLLAPGFVRTKLATARRLLETAPRLPPRRPQLPSAPSHLTPTCPVCGSPSLRRLPLPPLARAPP